MQFLANRTTTSIHERQGNAVSPQVWKPAIQQAWKPALRRRVGGTPTAVTGGMQY